MAEKRSSPLKYETFLGTIGRVKIYVGYSSGLRVIRAEAVGHSAEVPWAKCWLPPTNPSRDDPSFVFDSEPPVTWDTIRIMVASWRPSQDDCAYWLPRVCPEHQWEPSKLDDHQDEFTCGRCGLHVNVWCDPLHGLKADWWLDSSEKRRGPDEPLPTCKDGV